MVGERIKNTKSNIVFGVISKLTSILLPFLTRTFLIMVLGLAYTGINGLVTSILQVLSLADLGLSSAIVFCMYKPIAEDDVSAINALLSFFRKVYRIIGLIIVGAGLALVPFLRFLIKGDVPNDINIIIVYLIFLANTGVSYFLFAHKRSLLTALQKNQLVSKITIAKDIVAFVLQTISLFLFKNYYVFISVTIFTTVFDGLLCGFISKKFYPQFFEKGDISKETKSEIIKKTRGLLVLKICGITRNAFDNIFISAFLGLTIVGIYSNYYYILSSIKGVLDVITVAMVASIGNSVATETREKNYLDLRKITFMYKWICGWCSVCLLCLYQPFMFLWLRDPNAMLGMKEVIALSFYFYVWTMGDIKSNYTDATGLWDKEKLRTIVEAICNIVLNYLLVRLLGVFGIIIATGISLFVVGFPWSISILFKNYFKNGKGFNYWISYVLHMVITALIAAVTFITTNTGETVSISSFLIQCIKCVLIPNLIFFLIYFYSKDFKNSLPLIKKVLLRR